MAAVSAIVTWRKGGKPKLDGRRRGTLPIGIANCRIISFGEAEDGTPAARIILPPGLGGQEVVAAVADLYVDD